MLYTHFEDLDVWKLSRQFTKEIYQFTSEGKFSKDYGLRDQLQRAAVSIMLNLAEGFDSGSPKSFKGFTRYSYRSASEVKAILYVALDINYITKEQFNLLKQKIERIQQTLGGLMNYLTKKIISEHS